MSKNKPDQVDPDDMLDDYDFSGGVRGKYAGRFAEGSKVIVLDPDVAEVFADAASVNEALRQIIQRGQQGAKAAQ
jgi:hypothetical protein